MYVMYVCMYVYVACGKFLSNGLNVGLGICLVMYVRVHVNAL